MRNNPAGRLLRLSDEHHKYLRHACGGVGACVSDARAAVPVAAGERRCGCDSGRGGDQKVIQMLEPATLSLISERRVSQPWGLAGGSRGAVGENWLWPGGEEHRRVRLGDK